MWDFSKVRQVPGLLWSWLVGFLRVIGNRMVTIVSVAFLLASVCLLCLLSLEVWRQAGSSASMAVGESGLHMLVLIGLILGFAILIQAGDGLVGRLRKLGPAEFGEAREAAAKDNLAQVEALIKRLQGDAPRLDVADKATQLTPEEEYIFGRASSLVDYLEWSGADLQRNESLQKLVSKVGVVYLDKKQYPQAIDRFQYLLDQSKGSYQPFEVHYRLALAKCHWGIQILEEDVQDNAKGESLLRDSILHAHAAINSLGSSSLSQAYTAYDLMGLAYEKLGKLSDAIHWYKKSADENSRYAPALYNYANCLQRRAGAREEADLRRALTLLEGIQRDHEAVDKALVALERAIGGTSQDLKHLLGHNRGALVVLASRLRATSEGQQNPR